MRILRSLCVAATLVVPMVAMAQASRAIPLRDFFRNVDQAGHQVSPDGKYVSWVAPYERRLNVHRTTRSAAATRCG